MKLQRATYVWTQLGDLLISLGTNGQIHDDDWSRFIADLKVMPVKRFLSMAVGLVEINSVQRKQASELLKSKGITVAVVTDERLVRGIVTAASWLGVNVKSFGWVEIRKAIGHIGIQQFREEQVLTAIEKLKKEAGKV